MNNVSAPLRSDGLFATQCGPPLRMDPISCLGAAQRTNDGDVTAASQLSKRGAEVDPAARVDPVREVVGG